MFFKQQHDYAKHARDAITYVRSKLIFGSNTERDSRLATWHPELLLILRKEVLVKATIYALEHQGKADFPVVAKINKKALKKYGFGNCGEQAQTAYIFLKKRGVLPLDFCVTTEGFHNLVVIGRKKDSDPNDMSTWGEFAIVCDPWAEKIYPLFEFEAMQKPEHDVKYADICYREGTPPPPYLAGTLISQFREEAPEDGSEESLLNIRP